MATSTAQTIPLIEVYDYVLASGDPASATTAKGLVGKRVKATLQYDKALTIAPDAVIWSAAGQATYAALTDGNGFWHLFLTPNNKISPANTYYTVEVEGGPSYQIQVTDVGVPAVGWQSSAPGILLNVPAALAPTTSTVGAITATGLITAQAGINVTAAGATIVGGATVSGGETLTGGLTVDTITYSAAASRLIAGATSFSVRDNANANDNLLVSNAGLVTARAGLVATTGGLTVTAGGVTVSAGGAAVTGNSTVTGTLTVTAALTVNAGGAAITGNSTVTGTLTVTGTMTLSGAPGQISMAGVGTAALIGGTTGFNLQNNANNAPNLAVTDVGLVTLRNALLIPPSAGGAVVATSYGSVPVLIDTQTPATAASFDFVNPLPTGFRSLMIDWDNARGDTAQTSTALLLRFNNDSAGHYDYQSLVGNGATASAVEALAQTFLQFGDVPAASATANFTGSGTARINGYSTATGLKSVHSNYNYYTGNATTNGFNVQRVGKWQTVSTAVTRITVLPFAGNISGTFRLWGLP